MSDIKTLVAAAIHEVIESVYPVTGVHCDHDAPFAGGLCVSNAGEILATPSGQSLVARTEALEAALGRISDLSKGEPTMRGTIFPANGHRMGRIHNTVREAFGEEPLTIAARIALCPAGAGTVTREPETWTDPQGRTQRAYRDHEGRLMEVRDVTREPVTEAGRALLADMEWGWSAGSLRRAVLVIEDEARSLPTVERLARFIEQYHELCAGQNPTGNPCPRAIREATAILAPQEPGQ